MPLVQKLYRRLLQIDDPSIDRALAAALPSADAQAIRALAATILERRQAEGEIGLILYFHLLPEDVQNTVVRFAADLARPLRQASSLRQTDGPANVISIICRAKRLHLSYLATERLRHGPADLRPQAAACLLDLARWARIDTAHAAMPACSAATAQFLVNAVEEAVGAYPSHQQPMVLQAVTTLAPRAIPSAMRNLGDWHHPVVEPMRRLLERPPDPAVRRFLIVAGRMPTLMNAALAGIHCAVQQGKLGEVVEASHLLLVGSMLRNVKRLADPDRYWPQPEQIEQMPAYQTRGLPRWLAALPLESAERVARLSMLKTVKDAPTRLGALRQLLALSDEPEAELWGVHAAISTYTADPDPVIARIALRQLVRCKWKDLAQLLLRLVNSGHTELRTLAAHYLSTLGFDRLWNSWSRLSFTQQLAAGRAMIKIDPRFHRQLGEKLSHMDRPARLRAMEMIQTLNLGAAFEQQVIALVHDQDEVAASAAVRVLGTTQTPAALQTLEKALDHEDSRVRANAVEALQTAQSTRHVQKLMEMAQTDDARPRANAIAALLQLRAGDALGALGVMLTDSEPKQRISALWLVDHLGLIDVARQVAELSITDQDQAVRARAGAVIRHLIDSMAGNDPAYRPASAGA